MVCGLEDPDGLWLRRLVFSSIRCTIINVDGKPREFGISESTEGAAIVTILNLFVLFSYISEVAYAHI